MKQLIQKKAAEYFFYFILYSFIGWVYEVFLEVVVYRWGFSNRGVLFGPYCIIYGVGALILIFTLGGLKKKTDLPGPSVHHAGSCFYRNCGNHNRTGTGRKLYHGASLRRVAVGLHPFFI